MRRWLWFAITLALLGAGLLLSQTHKIDAPVSPDALLFLVADTEREVTRLPMAYTRIPDAEEISYGDRIAKWREVELNDQDKLIEEYVQRVGQKVAANAHRRLPYRFHYLPERYFVNAFALPGGHVYVGAGMLALMDNEDELASVLGHEIEHIDHYHCAERLQVQAALKRVPLGELAEIPIELFQIGYNKDQEMEADREGTRLAVRAGYSPQGAVQLFARFQKMEEQVEGSAKTPGQEMSGAAIQVLTGYFRSHPRSADRAAQIRSLIQQEGWKSAPEKPLELKYIFLGYEAQDQLASAHFDKAVKAAEQSLNLHHGYAPALVVMAKAKIASGDAAGAMAAYKELLAPHPNEADEVRNFVGQLVDVAMRQKKYSDAARLAAFSLELQPNNANALRLLANVDLELGDINAATETGLKLRKLYPDMGAVLLQDVNNAAEQALQRRDYDRVARFAAYSLTLEPMQPEARSKLAQAEYARANWRAAADAYARLISDSLRRKEILDADVVRNDADALGSLPDHKAAAEEFTKLLEPVSKEHDDFALQVRIEQAGLEAMAGDYGPAQGIARPLTAPNSEAIAPEHMSRLGWWYYRAGKFDAAEELLRRAMTLRPGDYLLQQTLAWVLLEKGNSQEASRIFEGIPIHATYFALRDGGLAAAHWRVRQVDRAMMDYERLISAAPEWKNEQWVRAIYGASVAQSMKEMAAEQDRRIAARKATLHLH